MLGALRRLGPILPAAMLALATCPGAARAEVGRSCTGVLPIAVVLPERALGAGSCAAAFSLPPDSYGGVRFPSCEAGACTGLSPVGSDAVRCLVANGSACCLDTGDRLRGTAPKQAAVFNAALADRWSADADQRQGICFASYSGTGQRILRLPVAAELPAGDGQVTVTGFITAFLVSAPRAGALEVQVLPAIALPVHAPTWGALRIRYR